MTYRLCQIWRCCAPPFYAIFENPQGSCINPPGQARVSINMKGQARLKVLLLNLSLAYDMIHNESKYEEI